MVDYILGNYLVENGKISKEQLKEILKKQDSVRVKLGLIAVTEGMMTREEADKVNRLQAVRDKRFGDIAVEEGYLTETQVTKLLKEQGNTYLMFVQALLDENIFAMDEWEWLLENFKKENGFSNSELEDLKSDDVSRIIPLLLPEEAKAYQELVCTVIRTMIRLIDRHIYVGNGVMAESFPTDGLAIQKMEGTGNLVDCFAERDGALLQVSSVFGREEFAKLDADALDAAGELLNCVNGLYASAASREGRFLELMPPEYAVGDMNFKKNTVCRIPVFLGDKGLYFVIGELA